MRPVFAFSPDAEEWYVLGYRRGNPLGLHPWWAKHRRGRMAAIRTDGGARLTHWLPQVKVGSDAPFRGFRESELGIEPGFMLRQLKAGISETHRAILLSEWVGLIHHAWYRRNPTTWEVPLQSGGWFEPPAEVGEILEVEVVDPNTVSIRGVPATVTPVE